MATETSVTTGKTGPELSELPRKPSEPAANVPLYAVSSNNPRTLVGADQFLLLYDRVPRRSIGCWARELLDAADRLLSEPTSSPNHLAAVVACSNTVSLIELYVGLPDRAEETCYATLRWLAESLAAASPLEQLALALQPWVNLGRLRAIRQQADVALRAFALLHAFMRGEEVVLGPVTLPSGEPSARSANASLTDATYAVYVIDSIRTLLLSHRHEQVLSFITSCSAPAAVRNANFLWEGQLISLAALGREAELQRHACARLRNARAWETVVLRLRLADSLARCDHPDSPRMLLPTAAFCQDLATSRRMPHVALLHACHYGLQQLRRLGLIKQALDLARAALGCAQWLGDEPFTVEFLCAIVELDPASHREVAALETLRNESQYRRVRAKSDAPRTDLDRLSLALRRCLCMH